MGLPIRVLAQTGLACRYCGWRSWLVAGGGASRILRLPAAVCEDEAWRVVSLNVVDRDQSASCSASAEEGALAPLRVSRAFRIAVAGRRGPLRSVPGRLLPVLWQVAGLRHSPFGAQ